MHSIFLSQGSPGSPHQAKQAKGLGDVVAKVIAVTGAKPCGGCKKRQEWLNRKVPFK